jgi:hypothetical protein
MDRSGLTQLGEMAEGQEATAAEVIGAGDTRWVRVTWSQAGQEVEGCVLGQDLAAEWAPAPAGVRTADEKDLPALLESAFVCHEYVDVNVGRPAEGVAGPVRVSVTRYGPEDGPRRGKAGPYWVCEVRTREAWRETSRVLVAQAGYLQATAEDRPEGLGFEADRVLRLMYRLPPHEFPALGAGGHFFFSREAQQYLRVQRAADPAAERTVLVFEEPHQDKARQYALYRGLKVLFDDNPFLLKDGQTAFLAEGLPADRPAPIRDLIDAAPDPSDGQVRAALDSYLIPGYMAYAWKFRHDIPVVGHEDPELYRIAARLWIASNTAVPLTDEAGKAQTLWVQAVAARNASMARTLLGELDRRAYPMLFLGGRHLDGLLDHERVDDPGWDGLAGVLNAADFDRLRKADKRGVAEYLHEKGVGHHLIDAAPDPFADADTAREEDAQYLALFQAQAAGNLAGYLDQYVRPPGGTTVAPDPGAAAKIVVRVEEDDEDEEPSAAETLSAALSHVGAALDGADAPPKGAVPTSRYGDMSGALPAGEQANHLNQDAAFRSIIPKREGVAVAMRGNAFTEPQTPHYKFHKSLETFWEQYRRKGARKGALYGKRPTSRQYGAALRQALIAAGYSAEEADDLAEQAARQRRACGLQDDDLVPRIPGRMNQRGP